MTPSEFRAWFEGFTENIPKVPTQKQWARICRKVKDIDDVREQYIHIPTVWTNQPFNPLPDFTSSPNRGVIDWVATNNDFSRAEALSLEA